MSDPTGLTDSGTALAGGFDPADEDAWLAAVDKVLKGAPFTKLVSSTADGITVQPLYTPDSSPGAADEAGFPGQVPFTRGSQAARPLDAAWDVRSVVSGPDVATANARAIQDLERGVTSLEVNWDGDPERLRAVLDGVHVELAPIALRPGYDFAGAADAMVALWTERGLDPSTVVAGFGADPIAALATHGADGRDPAGLLEELGALAARTAAENPSARAVTVSTLPAVEAGASEAQELAVMLSVGAAYLRAMSDAGMTADDAAAQIQLELGADEDVFATIAKLRAARRLWATLLGACGVSEDARAPHVHAVVASRMLTRRDPWVNMLRTTIATSAAAMGGADAITVLPFTWALGKPDAFARRIARNTQVVLQEESHLGRVADPAGGSWYVESLTADLAKAAWSLFQEIESEGGIGAALGDNHVHDMIAATAAQRNKALSTGKLELTGTSAFPKLGSDGVNVEPWPAEALSADLKGARVKPLPMARLSEPFEALRDAADKANRPARVFLATLGPLAVHAARATWIRNFCAAGGIDCVGGEPIHNSADAGKAFAESGATVAIIASSDDVYAELGEATAGAVKAAGAKAVFLAGRQKDEGPLRAAGVDGFIFAGADMIATLKDLHGKIGV